MVAAKILGICVRNGPVAALLNLAATLRHVVVPLNPNYRWNEYSHNLLSASVEIIITSSDMNPDLVRAS